AAEGSELSLIEGVMGLFDGKGGENDIEGSTAQVAKILKAPVILVLDVKQMAQSAAALAYGYQKFDPQLNVAGVILNNVSGRGHYKIIAEFMARELELEVLGYLPAREEIELPERHLGLVPAGESEELEQWLTDIEAVIKKNIALEKVVSLAGDVPSLEAGKKRIFDRTKEFAIKLGVAYDRAFNFYYQDNLDILEEMGAELKYFSPVEDRRLPDVDGLYIGGGFPEEFLPELAGNKKMREEICRQVIEGLPVYAECGGLAYLTEKIVTVSGEEFSMLGLIPGKVIMKESLQAMGYVKVRALKDNLLLKAGEVARGHEFHYSKLVAGERQNESAYQLTSSRGQKRLAGIVTDNLLASYVHLHFGSKPELARRFLQNCQRKPD
ncbi:MAG: cobyrinate a,c-diamide synthase, partial [Halanaerobiales bacterium]